MVLKQVLIGLLIGGLLTFNWGVVLPESMTAGNDDTQPKQQNGVPDSSKVTDQNKGIANSDDIFVSKKSNLTGEEIARLTERQSNDPNLVQMKAGNPQDTYRMVALILVLATLIIICGGLSNASN